MFRLPPRLPDEQAARRSRLRRLFTDDVGLKGTALLLSLLLWIIIGARTPTESYITVQVEPTLDSTLVLLGDAPHVRALVSGRAADIVKLYATPPVVRRNISGEAPDTLVLDLLPSDVHIPPELLGDVRVLDVQPRSVTLRFETRATRRVEVVNDGHITVRGGLRTVKFDPSQVRVTGPRGTVRHLRSVHPVSLIISAADTLSHLAELDTAGLGVRVNPAQVRVRLGSSQGH